MMVYWTSAAASEAQHERLPRNMARLTGIDPTRAFCEVTGIMSGWVGLGERTEFLHGDATNLPFPNDRFDAATTLHVAMNMAAKDRLCEQARRVLKPGGIFAVYDSLQGEGGEAYFRRHEHEIPQSAIWRVPTKWKNCSQMQGLEF